MRFLVTTRTKDEYYAIPQEQRLELMQRTIDFVNQQRQAGTCREIYFAHDMKGSVGIWELESERQRALLLLENPMWTHIDIQMEPVMEWKASVNTIREYYAQPATA